MARGDLIAVAQADLHLAALVPRLGAEAVPLARAGGRVLAEPIRADRDGPPFDRAALDGFVVRGLGRTRWTRGAFLPAGAPPPPWAPGCDAIEVATGAVVPPGSEALVPYEEVERGGSELWLRPGVTVRPGQNIHRRGEDFRTGDTLLPEETALRAHHFHALASVGCHQVPVRRRPRWGLLATGTELVEVDQSPQDWQIRRSNAAVLAAEALAWGLAPHEEASLADEEGPLEALLGSWLETLDAVVVTGGVSQGLRDLVPALAARLGAQTVFHGVDMKPGKPFLAAVTGGGVPLFGLPGNPVSSLVVFRRFVLPWLLAADGRKAPVHPLEPDPGSARRERQTLFLPWSGQEALDWRGSGHILALEGSVGLVEVGPEGRCWHPWGL